MPGTGPCPPGTGRADYAYGVKRGAYLLNLGRTPYREAWDLQRALAAAVSQGAIPDTVVLLEHPPVITLGRRTDEGAELHVPDGAEVEVVETDRGGKSTFHGPGQLVCYPILDLNRHGRDVKRYVRDLEEAVIRTAGALGRRGDPHRGAHRRLARVAAAQARLDRRPHRALGDDARLRAQRRPRPGPVHGVDHGLRARGRGVHDARARARPAGRRSTRCARSRPPRSRRSSAWPSRSSRPRTAPGSGHSRCMRRSRRSPCSRPPDPGRRSALNKSLPVAERPRRPEWMKVRAPSADSRYFEVRALLHGAGPEHDLRGGALPEHRRVLGPRHGDVPDPRRHLHARLPLLLRPLRQARARRPTRSSRCGSRRPRRRWASSTSSSPPSTATTSPTAAPATTRPRSARCKKKLPDASVEVLTPDFLGVEEEALATVLAARPEVFNHNIETVRRLHREDARREGLLRQGALAAARAKELADYPVLTKSGIIVGLGETNDEVVETMRDLRAHGVDVVTIGQYLQPSSRARGDRPLGAPRRVPLVPRAGRGARLRLGLLRPARPLVVPRRRAAPRGRDRPRRGRLLAALETEGAALTTAPLTRLSPHRSTGRSRGASPDASYEISPRGVPVRAGTSELTTLRDGCQEPCGRAISR